MENGGSMLGGYHAAQRITVLPEKATAAFVLSDIGAMGLIKGLNEMGKKYRKTSRWLVTTIYFTLSI